MASSIEPRDVCIVGVARTPMGGFLGSLSSFSATQLGSIAIRAALKRANLDPSLVQEVFFGNVLSANLGQAPARQAALGAGIPNSVICTTINKVCSSGIKAMMCASQSIQLGINDVVVAGGMESMSNAPKYLQAVRKGSRLGHDTIVDGMIKDGLWDVYNDIGMGVCAEMCADKFTFSREEQDAYAIRSFSRGIDAKNNGLFAWEIVPVEIPGGRGRPSTIVDKDDGLEKFDATKLKKLRPSFKNGGSVTAGNASSISDGAAALVLVSGKKALQLGLQVIAKIKGYADAAQAPEWFTTAPSLAIPKAISNAGLEASQIDYYEINEAFSVHKALPGSNFNSLLLNRYGGGNDYVGWHADDEKLYGLTPEIASVSLGCEREFLLKKRPIKISNERRNDEEPARKRLKKSDQHSFILKHGSLLVMKGYTQRDWLHSVPRRAKVEATRINLTFRLVV